MRVPLVVVAIPTNQEALRQRFFQFLPFYLLFISMLSSEFVIDSLAKLNHDWEKVLHFSIFWMVGESNPVQILVIYVHIWVAINFLLIIVLLSWWVMFSNLLIGISYNVLSTSVLEMFMFDCGFNSSSRNSCAPFQSNRFGWKRESSVSQLWGQWCRYL